MFFNIEIKNFIVISKNKNHFYFQSKSYKKTQFWIQHKIITQIKRKLIITIH